jgi:hypothetical protein
MDEKKRLAPETMLLIRSGDAQSVLDYLSVRPCGEVYALVTVLLNLSPAILPATAPQEP